MYKKNDIIYFVLSNFIRILESIEIKLMTKTNIKMTNSDLNYNCELIFNKLFSIESENKNNEELIELIKPILIDLANEQRQIGRSQILNNMEDKIKELRNGTN